MALPPEAKSRWNKLDSRRQGQLDRARSCAALTLPHLLPPEGHTEDQELNTPYQGLGARGVNNIASKLLLSLAPVNTPFFKFTVDDVDVARLTGDKDNKTKVEKGLAEVERTIMGDLEAHNTRVVLFEALKHLVVTGNVLLFQAPDGDFKMWSVDKYVVRRDPMGKVKEIILKETIFPDDLTDEVAEAVGVDKTDPQRKEVEIYTVIERGANKWEVHQEINDIQVPDSQGSYPLDEPAYLALRLSAIPEENYGRGLVEEYLGDLRSLEGLMKAIVVASAAVSKILFLRAPSGSLRARDIENAESGDIITGNEEDLSVLQVDKYPDFRVALDAINELTERLSHAFLLNTAVQRDAERVTATEIRFVAQELEDALGGIYSVLTQELQLPLIKRRMSLLRRRRKLPPLPEGIVKPVITTGMQALGRGHDVDKLRALLEDLSVLGPEVLETWMNIGDFIQRVATAHGIDSDNLIYTPEQVSQRRQQQQMAELMQSAGPGAIQEFIKNRTEGGING